jgi:hypothetical protein
MKGKPNVDSFIAGGAAAAVETQVPRAPAPVASMEEGRLTKSIRITRRLDRALKEEAHRRTMAGARTSESDLIEEALLRYFNS